MRVFCWVIRNTFLQTHSIFLVHNDLVQAIEAANEKGMTNSNYNAEPILSKEDAMSKLKEVHSTLKQLSREELCSEFSSIRVEVTVQLQDAIQQCENTIVDLHTATTRYTEMREVYSAMNETSGNWYRCPNGHLYRIGECGRAMQESHCPECGALIGGSQHRSVEGNTLAEDFDRLMRIN